MTEQQLEARVSGARVFLFVVLLAIAVPIAWTAVTAVWHFPQPVYRLTPTRLLVTLAACAAVLAGLRALWDRPNPGLTLGGLLAPMLWVLTVLGAASIGVLVLPVAILVTIAVITASTKAGGGAGGAAAIGTVVAVSLGVLLLAQPWTAAVRCGEHSVSTSSRPFDGNSGGSSGSGVSSAMPDDPTLARPVFESAGNVDFGGDRYVYRCRDGDLVEFRRVP